MSLQLTRQQQLALESRRKLVGRIALLETTLQRFLTEPVNESGTPAIINY